MKEKLFKIISQVMNVPLEEINDNTSSDNIEAWDSLQLMNLVLALEEEFHIKLLDKEIVHMSNVQNILDTLSKRVNEN